MNKRAFLLPALTGLLLLFASAAHAQLACVLAYDSGEAFKNGTPCADARTAGGGTKNIINLTCGAAPVLSAVFEQQSGSTVSLAGYEVAFNYKTTDFGAPTCDWNPKGYFGTASPIQAECPGSTNNIHGAMAIFDAGNFGSSPYPNLELIRVTFASWLGADGATSTTAIDLTDWIMTTQDSNEIQPTKISADAVCRAPSEVVKEPTGISVSAGTPTCAGNPPTGTVTGIKINFTKPTQCEINGVVGACQFCTELAVKVEKTSPGGTETIAAEATSSPVTDTTARTAGTELTYRLTGVCKTGSASASTSKPTVTHTPACGAAPSIVENSITVANKTVADSAVCPPSYALQNLGITVKGTIDDTDSTSSQLTASLYYGTEDNDPAFPTAAAATIGSSKAFEAQIPGTAVRKDTDIYWALWATDQVTLSGKYPTDFDGTIATANTIPSECIGVGTHLDFAETPYPNQFPFRAGNQRLVVGFKTNEASDIAMRIYDVDGRLMRQIENSSSDPYQFDNVCNWQYGCSWDGTDYLGGNNLVPNGLYIVNIYAIGTGSNFYGQTINYTKGLVVMK